MTVLKVTKNDVGIRMDFTAKNANGTIIDLTDSTITFRMKEEGATTYKISGSCTISGATQGTCYYTATGTDLDTEGIYKGEVEVVSGSMITTGVGIEVRVGGELG